MPLIKILNYVFVIGSLFMLIIELGCNKEPIKKNNEGTDTSVTITLWNKPLPVIQSYIKGHWNLQYTMGGFTGGIWFDKYNEYMILSSDRIILGNDAVGIYVDTAIIWVRAEYYSSNDSTFFLCYNPNKYSGHTYSPNFGREIVYAIKNDTLIILDDGVDGFYFFYSK